jgi:FkbH-like protein
MNSRHEDMTWLVPPPEDFRARCAALDVRPDGVGRDIQSLATARLDANQLARLSATIKRAQERRADLSPLSPFKLAVLGNATTCLYVPALSAAAARHGIALTTIQSEYDQVMQEALAATSGINTCNPDAVLLALDFHGLPFGPGMGPGAALDYVETVRLGLQRGCGAPVIFQTVVCPPAPVFGSLDARVPSTIRQQTTAFNAALVELAAKRGDYVLDIASVAEMVGTQSWQDPVQWNLYKLPLSQTLVPVYVEHVARLLGALRGKSRKCLVLDLDNTLWGGVIGDDGLDGISIGQGDGTAEAHLEVQRVALELRQRGIVLAVCSKNDDAVARQPFREHPDMLLREEHITVFVANWQDKASNLEFIAQRLNIGLDALVLLDDNPAERKQVRDALPDVAVPELPADPSLYARTLLNAGYFEAVSFSEEDKTRADQYQANAQREELASGTRNMDQFLTSLDMTIEFGPFTPLNAVRVTQLINKTNQFNLTTRRYTQSQVEAMMASPDVITLQARLLDRFGDNGTIAIVIARVNGTACEIDTWLMSCRVLGRRVEEAVMAEIVRLARAQGLSCLTGRYTPSAKNSMVADHYSKLEFVAAGRDGQDTLWDCPLNSPRDAELPFQVVRAAAGSGM